MQKEEFWWLVVGNKPETLIYLVVLGVLVVTDYKKKVLG